MNRTVYAVASEIGYGRGEQRFPAALDRSSSPGVSGVSINRAGSVRLFSFTDFFKGFEGAGAVRSIFGARTKEILGNLEVEFFSFKFRYMAVSDVDGHLLVSIHHLQNSEFEILYLLYEFIGIITILVFNPVQR